MSQTIETNNAPTVRLPDLVGLPEVEVPIWNMLGVWIAGQSAKEHSRKAPRVNREDHASGLWSCGNTKEEALANYHARKPGAKKRHVWPEAPKDFPPLPENTVCIGCRSKLPVGILSGDAFFCISSSDRWTKRQHQMIWSTGPGYFGQIAVSQAEADRIAAQMEGKQ